MSQVQNWGRDALVASDCPPRDSDDPEYMAAHQHLPHLRPFAPQPIVFVTTVTCDRQGLLACAPAHAALRATWEASAATDGWYVGRYVVMPDHVHLFARAAVDAKPLAAWIRSWKSISSRRISSALAIQPPIWQRNYFDRFLRSAESYSAKWDYVVQNPVRKGLVSAVDDWPWRGVIHDLEF